MAIVNAYIGIFSALELTHQGIDCQLSEIECQQDTIIVLIKDDLSLNQRVRANAMLLGASESEIDQLID